MEVRPSDHIRPAGVQERPPTHQDVGAGDAAEPQVLHGALLQLHVGVPQLAVGAQHVLDGGFDLGEQVDELDVGGQQEGPGRDGAQVELGVEEVELDQRAEGETVRGAAAIVASSSGAA